MSGPMTSCFTGRMTAGPSARSTSWTSSPARVWRSRVRRKLSLSDIIDVLIDLFILRGILAWIPSDNGPEFVAEAVRRWLAAVGARSAFIEPGSSWENGYIESFNAPLRDEHLNREIHYILKEAQVLTKSRRCHYNPALQHPSVYAIDGKRFC